MNLFKLTDTESEFKCSSGQKKTFIDPNGGKIKIDARWGSLSKAVEIDTPKWLWSSGYKMPVALTLMPPDGKFVKDKKVEFKAGAEDYSFKAEWLETAPPEKSKEVSGDAFDEAKMTKPLSTVEQILENSKASLEKSDMIMGLLSDLINN